MRTQFFLKTPYQMKNGSTVTNVISRLKLELLLPRGMRRNGNNRARLGSPDFCALVPAGQFTSQREQCSSNWPGRTMEKVLITLNLEHSKKNLEILYAVLAQGSIIINVSPTTSTIKEPGRAVVTVWNNDIATFGTLQEKQTPVKVYADRRGPPTCEKLIDEQIQSHVEQFTRKLKGNKKMKQRRRETGSGV